MITLTRQGFSRVYKLLSIRDSLQALFNECREHNMLSIKRDVHINQTGKTEVAFLDDLTAQEATTLRKILQVRIDILNTELNAIGVDVK